MSSPAAACDRELLRQSLNDALSESQEDTLARHLSECPACQREIERLAAEEKEWSQVCDVLRREASAGSSQAACADVHDADHDLATDFAVDFLEPSDKPQTLGRLGDIDILEVIGRGGMGIVLKGFQPELNRPVAVKVLAPHLATSSAARQRFAREAMATAVIVHPNVMPILTVNSQGKLPFLVMPYVACQSLQQRIDRHAPLAALDVLRIGLQVARGLAAAHAQGLVHRDIKPANILLERGVDRVMLTDFGLARAVDDASLTRTGVIAGTPQYMSPEQARGEPIDARSDLFSLGSVLYAMGAGRPPFRAESTYGILRRITDDAPRHVSEINPQIPGWLAALIGKLLAKLPAERFQSATEVAELLEGCLAHVQQPSAAALPEAAAKLVQLQSPMKQTSVSAGRLPLRRVWVGVAAAAFVMAAVATSIYFRQPKPAESSAPKAAAPTATAPDADPATAWDEVAGQLDDLRRAADDLDARSRRLWDHEPSAAMETQDFVIPQTNQATAETEESSP